MGSSQSSIGDHGSNLRHVRSQKATWGHVRLQRSTRGHHRAQLGVIWDTPGHRGQLEVIKELNWRSRRSSGTRQVTEVNLGSSQSSIEGHGGYLGHIRSDRSAWSHQRGHLEVTEVIWDTSGHRGQLEVITELNWRSRRSSGTRQVTEVNLGSSQSSIGGHLGHVRSQRSTWGHHRALLEITQVICDTSGYRGQLGVITELNWRSSGTHQVTEVSLESSESSIGGHGGHLGHFR